MGLAASQARLLTITARLADNELRSQTINNAKMRLATQSSQASEDYISALNNATMKFSNYDSTGATVSQDLTYNALTAYSSYNTQYGLSNSSGQILVSEDEAAMFENANGDINTYLKAHGLEYTTTYFDEIGNLENSDYPSPYNNIDVETMKSYYEEYGSYQASLEKQEYENAYKTYASANNQLLSATSSLFSDFVTSNSNTTIISYNSNSKDYLTTFTGTTSSAILSELKTMFTGTNSNTYNINYLLNNNFINESAATEAKKVLNSFTTVTSNDIKYTTDANFTVPSTTNSDGTKTYVVDDYIELTVDSNGNVSNYKLLYQDEAGETTTITQGKSTGSSLMDYVNNLGYTYNYTDDDGKTYSTTVKYALSKDSKGNYTLKASNNYTDYQTFKDEIAPDILNQVMTILASGLNQETFSEYLLNASETTLNNYGISINSEITGSQKTLSQILDEYNESKQSYLELIFDANSISTVEEDINNKNSFTDDNGTVREVNAQNLSDIDFVLQYIKNKGLQQSEVFSTIIKENLVENLVEEYGEPKYAWVDENDTSNTGNADAKAQWYTNLFKRMQQGYKALENGLASSKEWIEYALESGIVSLEQVDTTFRWNSLDYKSCTKITEETDDAAVTKAEAEYNRAMNDIEAKDNIYDIELKNIDTEHTSLQTEYDVIKDVMKKNVERTFKFNQSA
jgi:hypothetical protein